MENLEDLKMLKFYISITVYFFVSIAVTCFARPVISEQADTITIQAGQYQYLISKIKCTIFEKISINGTTLAKGGSISYVCSGNKLFITDQPVRTYIQNDRNRIYQEGWFQHDNSKNFLYYIIRYEFYDNAPYVKLIITFTDRHDSSKAEAQWDNYWKNQLVSDIKVTLHVPSVTRTVYVQQHNAFDYRKVDSSGTKPYITLEERHGSPGIITENDVAGVVSRQQLQITSKAQDNWVRFYPLQTGSYPVSIIWNGKTFPPYAAYKRAKSIVARIHHTNGTSNTTFDQGTDTTWTQLGSYEFNNDSYIDITGDRQDGVVLIDAVKVGDKAISVFNRFEDHLSDNEFSLFIKDFWRQYPIAMRLENKNATVEFVTNPTVFMGGMGKTFEIMYVFGDTSLARDKLYAPPDMASFNGSTDSLYFSYATNSEYDRLTDMVQKNLLSYLEKQRSVGWRNWGDYQIGNSYGQTEDWGNLQYDLAYGLLMLYIRTKDPEMWHLAQAAVYHLMDIDLVKFSPFLAKYNGSVHRKGEMPYEMAHIATEPVVPENFAFRSLYLYYLLTGDLFARDCMKMSVDNFLEFTNSNARLDFASHGGRDTAWILLGLLAGYETFHNPLYLERATKVVDLVLSKEKSIGRIPSTQPVWQGQTVEALIRFYEITKDQRVRDLIVRHESWLKKYAFAVDPTTGHYRMIYSMDMNDFVPVNPKWTDESNYFFLHLNSLMYVYELTKDASFKQLADTLYQQAAQSQKRFVGPRQASSFLSFPFYYLEKSQ